MKISTKAFVLTFVAALTMVMPCMAQDTELPLKWEGKGGVSFIGQYGTEDIEFDFELSIDEQGMVTGQTNNEDGASKIKHVFCSEKKEYN